MKFETLVRRVGHLPLFSSGLLQAGDVKTVNLQKQLSRWTSAGKIHQLRRSLYTLAEPYRQVEPHSFLIANYLLTPSYVSLQSALAYYDLIPESVPAVTSITSRRQSKTTEIGHSTFIYHFIQRDLFTGYYLQQVSDEQFVYIAKPEKALLDLIYLTPQGHHKHYLESLRLQNMERINLDWMQEATKIFGMKKLIKATNVLSQLISETTYHKL